MDAAVDTYITRSDSVALCNDKTAKTTRPVDVEESDYSKALHRQRQSSNNCREYKCKMATATTTTATTTTAAAEAKTLRPSKDRIPLADISHNAVKIPTAHQRESEKETKLAPATNPTISSAASGVDLNVSHLISSPYSDLANQLQLGNLDTPYRLFAFALGILQPIRPDYATAPYLDSFNWDEVFGMLVDLSTRTNFEWKKTSFYVVIFRSKLQDNIDRERLGLLDQKSHEEACESGGLLKYWFGSPDAERKNLATCLWRDHQDAVAGGGGPWHKQARMAARAMYERIDFHVHELVVEDGAHSWRLEDFST